MNPKELEIRRQFLDEAQEYLDTLDDALLGAADAQLDSQKINAALRAAHSIKGGAGMMGFETLSALSHRLEDSFKVLKVKHQLDISVDLETLLLGAVDSLRQVIEADRLERPITEAWLTHDVLPIFDQLYEQLGEPQAEDAASILGSDDSHSIIPILFETEVEGCLQRLQVVLDHPTQPCLQEELSILAQELGGLGEMLQLTPFISLCESVLQALDQQPDRLPEIAQAALQTWRQTQALVIAGEFDNLPTVIAGDFNLAAASAEFESAAIANSALAAESDFDWTTAPLADDWQALLDQEPLTASFAPADRPTVAHQQTLLDNAPLTEASALTDDWQTLLDQEPLVEPLPPETAPLAETTIIEEAIDHSASFVAANREPVRADPPPVRPTDFRLNDGGELPLEDDLDATVRVPVRQLNQLSDLFGELTIERHGLDLNIKRLRRLSHTLSARLKLLENADTELRSAYDQEAPSYLAPALPLLAISPESRAFRDGSGLLNSNRTNPDPVNNNRFDVLEMDRYDSLHSLSQQVMETIVQLQEVSSDIALSLNEVDQNTRSLNSTSKKLQNNLTHLRLRPLSDVLDRFPRLLRELSLQYDKRVTLKITGGQTMIDRNILEILNDPLMHLIRNAFDHGIENAATRQARGKNIVGEIAIHAVNRGNRTVITLQDDGNGIPLSKIRQRAEAMGLDKALLATASDEDLLSLIFEPGFSTSDAVTALSGRGVGMDVVREHLKQIRGEIKVNTQAQLGTTFTLSVPFTLSIARVLLVESGGMLLAIPADAITEMFLLQPEAVITTANGEALVVKGQPVHLVRLSQWLHFNCPHPLHDLETPPAIDKAGILMVNRGSEAIALQIDRAWTEQEVTVRRVEGNLPLPLGFSSCTVFGDGRVVPLVNLTEMLNWIASCEYSSAAAPASVSANRWVMPTNLSQAPTKFTILIIDDSINVRRFLALTLERASYRVEQAKDGLEALEKLQAGLKVQGIICDVEMPRLDGFGFLAKIKANPSLAPVPIAMLTSRSGDKHRQLATSLGAVAYFSKPYNEQSLLLTLENLMRQPVAR